MASRSKSRVGDLFADEEAVMKDKRKAKVLKAAQVVCHRPFVPRLVRFLASDECSVQDVKQLEAVMQVPTLQPYNPTTLELSGILTPPSPLA
eukprot:4476838-Pyramimonas_sp.AAC.1